jgi:bacteriorhodopsin
VWGISIVALLGVTLVKYYGIKENNVHTIETSNNLFKLLVISLVVAWQVFEWRDENRNFRV